MTINTAFASECADIETEFTSTGDIHTEFCGVIRVENSDAPVYDGACEITPLLHRESKLETKGKMVKDNIIVLEIPYHEVSNKFGKTISIGG